MKELPTAIHQHIIVEALYGDGVVQASCARLPSALDNMFFAIKTRDGDIFLQAVEELADLYTKLDYKDLARTILDLEKAVGSAILQHPMEQFFKRQFLVAHDVGKAQKRIKDMIGAARRTVTQMTTENHKLIEKLYGLRHGEHSVARRVEKGRKVVNGRLLL